MKKRRAALVLAGGGARGVAHIGAIEELESQAPEPTLSENIIKLQIIDNHILYTMQSKSKSF